MRVLSVAGVLAPLPHTIDHIQPKQHIGTDAIDNLAYCCAFCNQQKGPNLAGIDPKTRRITRLFNPRTDEWAKHFRWDGVCLVGKTAIGRVIVYLMGVNDPERIATREALKLAGRW